MGQIIGISITYTLSKQYSRLREKYNAHIIRFINGTPWKSESHNKWISYNKIKYKV